MSNQTSYYFGAYLEIKTKQVEEVTTFRGCENDHVESGAFCSQCGFPVSEQTRTIIKHPDSVYDLLEDEDEPLATIRLRSLYNTGTIIAVGNLLRKPRGEWLYLGTREESPEIEPFPDVSRLIAELESNYSEAIKTLRQSENVISVTVKAGYVLDADY